MFCHMGNQGVIQMELHYQPDEKRLKLRGSHLEYCCLKGRFCYVGFALQMDVSLWYFEWAQDGCEVPSLISRLPRELNLDFNCIWHFAAFLLKKNLSLCWVFQNSQYGSVHPLNAGSIFSADITLNSSTMTNANTRVMALVAVYNSISSRCRRQFRLGFVEGYRRVLSHPHMHGSVEGGRRVSWHQRHLW